jgi:hypothetical protein
MLSSRRGSGDVIRSTETTPVHHTARWRGGSVGCGGSNLNGCGGTASNFFVLPSTVIQPKCFASSLSERPGCIFTCRLPRGNNILHAGRLPLNGTPESPSGKWGQRSKHLVLGPTGIFSFRSSLCVHTACTHSVRVHGLLRDGHLGFSNSTGGKL